MRLVVVIYSGVSAERVSETLDRVGAGYTRLDGAHGSGMTGRREGTRAWPGGNTVWFTAVPAESADALTSAIATTAGTLPVGERLRAVVLPVEAFI